MENGTSFDDILKRVAGVARSQRVKDLAHVLGVSDQAVSQALKKRKIPSTWIYKISSKFGISVEWLTCGNGPMQTEAATRENRAAPLSTGALAPASDGPRQIPVVGLAQCGLSGWYNPGPLAMRLPMPIDYPNVPEMFAVIAVGTSMQPEGIRQGYVLFCDPSLTPQEDDAVFVEKYDGTASVKTFKKLDGQWLHLQGWLAPDKEGMQKAYEEKLLREAVKRIVCVAVIQRKA